MRTRAARGRAFHRPGSVYAAVLAITSIMVVTAMTAVSISTSALRKSEDTIDASNAASGAASAVELALGDLLRSRRSTANNAVINSYAGPAGNDTGPTYSGKASLSGDRAARSTMFEGINFVYEDMLDADLDDDLSDPVTITGVSEVGRAIWAERAIAVDDQGQPIEPLAAVLHATDGIVITSTVTAANAPISSDGPVVNTGKIDGDLEALSVTGTGTVTGTTTSAAPRKGNAPRDLFEKWAGIATELTYRGDLGGTVLGPGVNTYDPSAGTNDHGIYIIRTEGAQIRLVQLRVTGTLIIDQGLAPPAGPVAITGSCNLTPARPDAPALIIRGDAHVALSAEPLTESLGNLNPEGAPSHGITDSDTLDSYPSTIDGLTWILGPLTLVGDATYTGSILIDGAATIAGTPTLIHDDMLLLAPPMGFGDNHILGDMRLLPRSRHRIAAP